MDITAFVPCSEWEYRLTPIDGMQVPVVLYSSPGLMQHLDPRLPDQLARLASLPGVVGTVFAMPDVQAGHGFPIGTVAAFDADSGFVCSSAVGLDIACGLRLMTVSDDVERIRANQHVLAEELFRHIPDGTSASGVIHLTNDQLDEMFTQGAAWAVDRGYGSREDLERIEDGGQCAGADPDQVSNRARHRQQGELGTLGNGSHYLEVGYVAQIHEPEVAAAAGLALGQGVVTIHSGSRGAGYQISTEFRHRMVNEARRQGLALPASDAALARYHSPLGRAFMGAVGAAGNSAYANRQALGHIVREVFADVVGAELSVLCDVAHNSCREELHRNGDGQQPLLVHRRGATRSGIDAGSAEPMSIHNRLLPIASSMGRPSYVAFSPNGNAHAFGSACHGTGRIMRRHVARRAFDGKQVLRELGRRGITVRTNSPRHAAEQAAGAHRDIEAVMAVAEGADLVRRVARLEPLIIIRR